MAGNIAWVMHKVRERRAVVLAIHVTKMEVDYSHLSQRIDESVAACGMHYSKHKRPSEAVCSFPPVYKGRPWASWVCVMFIGVISALDAADSFRSGEVINGECLGSDKQERHQLNGLTTLKITTTESRGK